MPSSLSRQDRKGHPMIHGKTYPTVKGFRLHLFNPATESNMLFCPDVFSMLFCPLAVLTFSAMSMHLLYYPLSLLLSLLKVLDSLFYFIFLHLLPFPPFSVTESTELYVVVLVVLFFSLHRLFFGSLFLQSLIPFAPSV